MLEEERTNRSDVKSSLYVEQYHASLMKLDALKDLSVIIVGDLVNQGLIKDCTDTDDKTEFEYQDAILNSLCMTFNVINNS